MHGNHVWPRRRWYGNFLCLWRHRHISTTRRVLTWLPKSDILSLHKYHSFAKVAVICLCFGIWTTWYNITEELRSTSRCVQISKCDVSKDIYHRRIYRHDQARGAKFMSEAHYNKIFYYCKKAPRLKVFWFSSICYFSQRPALESYWCEKIAPGANAILKQEQPEMLRDFSFLLLILNALSNLINNRFGK